MVFDDQRYGIETDFEHVDEGFEPAHEIFRSCMRSHFRDHHSGKDPVQMTRAFEQRLSSLQKIRKFQDMSAFKSNELTVAYAVHKADDAIKKIAPDA